MLVTRDDTELLSPPGMSAGFLTGWDIVLVVSVSGAPIELADLAVLESAIRNRTSGKFLFFTDGCSGCTAESLVRVLSMVNSLSGWLSGPGLPDNANYTATLVSVPFAAAFAGLPTFTSTAYSPVLGLPASNVLYTTDAPSSPGPNAGFLSSPSAACLFFSSDTTQFWTSGGVPQAQADALAAAYLLAADGECPIVAAVSARDCTPPNADDLTGEPAVLAQGWSAEVTHAGGTPVASTLLMRSSSLAGLPTSFGCLLVGGARIANLPGSPDTIPPIQTNQKNWHATIPNVLALVGRSWHAQALTTSSVSRFSNALDGVVGNY